jgi:hypothetical protein
MKDREKKLKKVMVGRQNVYILVGRRAFNVDNHCSLTIVHKPFLVRGTPGLNFINVLSTAFTLADPKSIKRYL